MTAAIAMSKKRSRVEWVPFKFPEKISMMARSRETRRRKFEIGLKLSEKCHISANAAVKEYLTFLQIIFSNDDRRIPAKIAGNLGLDADDLTFIKKTS